MVKPLATENAFDPEEVIAEFNQTVRKKMKNGKTREDAIAAIARKQPDLHKQFLLATNPNAKARRQIEEKYDRS
jgi:hypothetical protein